MSKISSRLGQKYQENKTSIFTKTFVLGDHTFKMKVPSVGYMDEMQKFILNPDEKLIDETYARITSELIELKDKENENIQFVDNDIIVDGKSMRETAKIEVQVKHRITKLIALLLDENNNTLDDIEYSDIQEEFPNQEVQFRIVDKILECIYPSYSDIRGK